MTHHQTPARRCSALGRLAPIMLLLCGLAQAEEPEVTFTIREAGKPERHVRITGIRHAPEAPPQEILAAQEVARYLALMTGVALPVNAEPAPVAKSLLRKKTR